MKNWVIVFCLVIFSNTLAATPKADARKFSLAYSTEKKDPAQAVLIYEKLVRGKTINVELRNAARWRLLHLYRSLLYLPEFVESVDKVSNSKKGIQLRTKMLRDLADELSCDVEQLQDYHTLVQQVVLDPERILELNQFLEQNEVFFTFSQEYFIRQNLNELAEALVKTNKTESILEPLRLAVQETKIKKALEIIENIETQKISDKDKPEFFYLRGKVYAQQEGQCFTAAVNYRGAAFLEKNQNKKSHYRALAGFELYRCGYASLAWGLLKQNRAGYSEKNIYLLRLLLTIEVNNSLKSREQLKLLREELIAGRSSIYSPWLVDTALKLLKEK